jgi:hypothetical protein
MYVSRTSSLENDMDWNEIARYTREAFRTGVNEWIGKARIQGGTVRGPAATLPPGSLVSDVHLEPRLVHLLSESRMPREVNATLARVLSGAWMEWAAGYQIHLPKAYPTLAAVPARFAPPTPAAHAPSLSHGHSHGEASLKAPQLAARLSSALEMHESKVEGGNAGETIQSLANWVDNSFSEWKAGVKIVGLLGQGPVPTFAPPYVPVGPVVAGQNVSSATLFAGPRFGKVVV